jgi:hypothetical protein
VGWLGLLGSDDAVKGVGGAAGPVHMA